MRQVSLVVIVDNASCNLDSIQDISDAFGALILTNSENAGIAKALNEGMQYLTDQSYEWVLTLDQDSVIEEGLVAELMECALSDKQCGISCPEIDYVGWSQKAKKPKTQYEVVKACMTSASMTSTKCWKLVGGFDESYFIDFVDNEFCMKLKLAGFKVIRNHNATLSHMLGTSKELNLGVVKLRYSHHAPIRYYYMIRNNIIFVKKYKVELNYLKELIKIYYIILMGIAVEHNKETLCYIKRGIEDARSQKMGIYEDK